MMSKESLNGKTQTVGVAKKLLETVTKKGVGEE